MVAAERSATNHPLPTLRRKRPGFDLEQLPATYTNKWAKFGAQEEEERAHHGRYLTLGVKAG